MNIIYKFLAEKEKEAFYLFRANKKITFNLYIFIFFKGIFSLIESLIRNISGPFGYIIRRYYYKLIFKSMGSDVLIDVGVLINGAQNIECGNKVWIDSYAILNCPIEKITIGNNVHIHTHSYIGGKEKVTISENCAIGSGSRLFTGSVNIFTPKSRPLLNTMIEVENEDDYNSGEITMKYNSLILTNCVVSPKTIMEEGSLLLSNSFLTKSTEKFSIYLGTPAKKIGKRR